MKGRLLLTLYLGILIVVFFGGATAIGLSGRRAMGPEVEVSLRHMLSDLVHRQAEPRALERFLDEVRGFEIEASIYGPDGQLVMSTVQPPLPLLDRTSERWDVSQSFVEDGRSLGSGRVRIEPPPHVSTLRAVLGALAFVAVVSVVLGLYVGRPLERIARAARRFGAGALDARAGLTRRDELGELSRAFDDMADRVTRLMSAQRELMANVSHELQTPLARIRVTIDLMLDGVEDKARELLPEISRDLDDVSQLVDDVITLSRIDLASESDNLGPRLRREPTEINELVALAVHRFNGLHPERNVILTGASDAQLDADQVLVRRVVENLLDNARKYSEPSTAIYVSLRDIAGAVEVVVEDHGIGIDRSDVKRVFTPFFRTDRSRSISAGGIGLGLALAKRVIEAHGGSIRVDSEPGRGTQVAFTLPTAA